MFICCIVLFPLIVIGAVATVALFLGSLSRVLDRCAPRNRDMTPGLVWLNFVPGFNVFWCFRTIVGVGQSVKNELADRELEAGVDFATPLGLVGASLGVAGWVGLLAAIVFDSEGIKVGGVLAWMGLSLVSATLGLIYWICVFAWFNRLKDDDRRRDHDRRRFIDDELDDEPDDDFPPRPGRTDADDRIR